MNHQSTANLTALTIDRLYIQRERLTRKSSPA